jgi:perosamine synthetase
MKKTIPPLFEIPKANLARIQSFLPSSEPRLTGTSIIPVCEPNLSAKEKRYLNEAFDSSWLSSSGDFVEKFERTFAKHVSHTTHALAVNSGTSALHVALVALGIGPGDEVILPTFTMIATINALTYCGAKAVLVDSDPKTWNIDVTKIKERITSKTKAILVVHTYGSPVDMDPVMKLARQHNLWIIEDAAEAHGATYKGKSIGSIGDVAAFSLYANKLITTGEGGITVTNDQTIAKRIDLLRNHAFSSHRHFWHPLVGFGYRMTNLQAAVGLGQTERFLTLLKKKRAHAALYTKILSTIPGITTPYESPDSTHSHWMYGITIDKKRFGISKDTLRQKLAGMGIETRSFFIPLHIQPAYYHIFRNERFPVAEQLCRDGLYLPSSSTLTTGQIRHICDVIRQFSSSKSTA